MNRRAAARASFYRNFSSVEDLVDYGIRQVTQRYHQACPRRTAAPQPRAHRVPVPLLPGAREPVLGFHRAKASTSLLDLVTDYEIASLAPVSASSPERYQLCSTPARSTAY
ncbi:MAG: hypothetical protein ACLSVD_06300 [Eggerthellaceae bacterium]